MEATDSEIAWVAGLFEGEGTIYPNLDKRNGRTYWHMNIRMTDEDVVRRAWEITGLGTFTRVKSLQARATMHLWKWSVTSRLHLLTLLPVLLPYMGERRAARMREALIWAQEPPGVVGPNRGTPWSPARWAAEERRRERGPGPGEAGRRLGSGES